MFSEDSYLSSKYPYLYGKKKGGQGRESFDYVFLSEKKLLDNYVNHDLIFVS